MSAPGVTVVRMRLISSPYERPFLRPASLNPFDIIGDGVVETLRDRGAQELSIRSVAKALGVTSQGLHQRLQSHRHDDTETPTAVLCRMASVALGQRWFTWVRESLMALAPEVPEILAATRDDERQLLADEMDRAMGRRPSDHQLVTLLALADGLRAQLVQPASNLPVGTAQEVMARQVASVLQVETRPAA